MKGIRTRRAIQEITAAFAAVILILSLTGHSLANQVESADRNNGQPMQHFVNISAFTFEPALLDVKPGDTITWINLDIVPHTATAVDQSWDTGELNTGERVTLTVSADYFAAYFCRYHPGMKARVVPVQR